MKETQILSYYNALSDYYTNTSGIIDSIRLNSARNNTLKIKKVILNDPATIVYWDDRTKTVVKVDHEKYDPEKGLAMTIAKKALGNQGNYYEVFKKWIGEDVLDGMREE